MRIRKHAKISPLIYAASSIQPATLVCQLNQSPWDVISFPIEENQDPQTPLPSFSYQHDGYANTGTFYDSIGTVTSVTSMKLDDEREMKEIKWDYYYDASISEVGGDSVKYENNQDEDVYMEELGLDKDSGDNLCRHHFDEVKHYNNYAKIPDKQQEAAAAAIGSSRHRPRAKKSSFSSSPYEFYYYSGFGPSWGRKRGYRKADSDATAKDVQCMAQVSNDSHLTQFSSSQINYDEFDYVEGEDVEEKNGKKKARKPIKARSLKSLM
ncbi:PREDICTED: uncharacterized protein LOC109208652 [Nicotiana attenuata]|uniref:Uncharacterized protein n=1 Tax=Nicotiana attenuata TaxID=49451 RepID=A0A314KRU0_NICAT|nr:PREDICTED: uncharacterized protein LOC109208652 [Nicotiana attenuata]OIT31459.1 hypothetical protein A4A49_38883 [Nicotiana attenuata]